MSPHAVNNFVSDLVLMAQAMEQLPQVKAELDMTKAELDAAYKIIQDRELRILDLKAELEAKSTNIRELEVAKDQAETMFLEADDRTARALEFVKTQFGAAGSLIQALEPPRAAIEVNPFANEPVVSEVKPIEMDPTHGVSMVQAEPVAGTTSAGSDAMPSPMGQSEPDPTHTDGQVAHSPVNEDGQSSASDVSGATQIVPDTQPSPGPYAGKRYQDVLHGVTLHQWLEGGGTEDDYYPAF